MEKQNGKHNAKTDVIKSFIAVNGKHYFEGETYCSYIGNLKFLCGLEKKKALLMTEDEVKNICSKYKGWKAINILERWCI